ncbi:MAG: DUF190 domain-containing protein [Acidimicrobiales bacterium]|jgi:PII-like signaling protein
MSDPRAPGRVTRPAQRLTILLTMHEHSRRRSLVIELLMRAHRAHLAGATVFRAYEGYGTSGRRHRMHGLSDDAPASIVIIDEAHRIETFLADVENLLDHAVVTIDEVLIVDV